MCPRRVRYASPARRWRSRPARAGTAEARDGANVRIRGRIHRDRPPCNPTAPTSSPPCSTSASCILDGAMGTMIQGYRLDEAGYRGACLAGHDHDVKGDNDLLALTQPDVVRAIHDAYLEAGADIVSSNTFNATSIAQADYGLEGRVREHQRRRGAARARMRRRLDGAHARTSPASSPARWARPTARRRSRPTSTIPARATSASTSSSPSYGEAIESLAEGGADLFLVETIFDTLNGKAALFALESCFDRVGPPLSGDRLRHDHRRLGPHAVGPDDRGVLELGAARAPARRRHQLLARRGADAPVHRGARARRRHVRFVLSERGAAESDVGDRLRRDARRRPRG